jgi:hypothetical protein
MCMRACWCLCAWACACAFVHIALLIQHVMRMHQIVTSFVAPLAPPYFSTLSHKWHDFQKTVVEHKICVFILSTIFIWNILILIIIQLDIVRNVKTSSSKVPVIVVGFYWNLNFLYRFSKKKSSNIKFHQNPSSVSRVVPCGRTDGHNEANSSFLQFFESVWQVQSNL